MSHLKERSQKNCLNCNAQVQGRFCSICGQENVEPKETVWHLISHFFEDITHFDGKFFSSVKLLLTKPGFLSTEYLVGRRVSYLNPIRMYVFTSAIFFLIFLNFYAIQKTENEAKTVTGATYILEMLKENKTELNVLLSKAKTIAIKDSLNNELAKVESDINTVQKDSTAIYNLKSVQSKFNIISFSYKDDKKYKTLQQYDSLQNLLPKDKRDNFFVRKTEQRNLYLKEKFHNNPKEIIASVKESFLHHFPQMLFVALPLFALILQLLYIRQKKFFYVNHAIFSLHLYIGTFIFILFGLWIGSIFGWFQHKTPVFVKAILFFGTLFFWYKSMRNFYQQSRLKTILKFSIILFLSFFLMILIFIFFFIFLTFTL